MRQQYKIPETIMGLHCGQARDEAQDDLLKLADLSIIGAIGGALYLGAKDLLLDIEWLRVLDDFKIDLSGAGVGVMDLVLSGAGGGFSGWSSGMRTLLPCGIDE
jgi:hypothetical protein